MQAYEGNKLQEPNLTKINGKRVHDFARFSLRVLALGASIAATWVMFTASQTTLIYGVEMEANYSYTSAFKFFAFANAIASVLGFLSLSLTAFLWRQGLEANHNLFFFMHDLVVMLLLLGACSAATAIGFVGKYGNDHAGWIPICDNFHNFCHSITVALIFGYFSFIIFLCLTILSSAKSTSHFIPARVQNP